MVWISSVVEVQQYQGIAARSSGYFIIADHVPVYSSIPDEYTGTGDIDWGANCWILHEERLDGAAGRWTGVLTDGRCMWGTD